MKGTVHQRAPGVFLIAIDHGRDAKGKRIRKWTTFKGTNDVGSQRLRDIADEVAKHPDWANSEAGRKDLIHWLYVAAYNKEPPQEPRAGEEL
jgi:hypothetical protein